MSEYTFRPAPLARKITLTLDDTALARPGHWRVPFDRVRALRLVNTSVRVHSIRELIFEGEAGRLGRVGFSHSRRAGQGDDGRVYEAILQGVFARLDPDTEVVLGQPGWVRWLLSVLGLACLGLAAAILILEARDDTIGPALVVGAMGSALLAIYWPLRRPPRTTVRALARRPAG